LIFEKVKERIAEVTGAESESITGEMNLKDDIGCDDLDIIEIVMALEEDFDIEIPDRDVEKIQTVNELVNYIKEATA
jgi:acyl carrier protein